MFTVWVSAYYLAKKWQKPRVGQNYKVWPVQIN